MLSRWPPAFAKQTFTVDDVNPWLAPTPDQRSFFLNSTGIGTQFTVLAHLIHSRACELGLGREMPGDWFTESIQP